MKVHNTASKPRWTEAQIADLISSVPGFNRPTQARSTERTHAIISATLELLQKTDGGSLRMQDIADRAGCTVTSIYARFVDKDALFGAIHALQLQECRPILDETVRLENFSQSGLFGLACAFIDVNEYYFSRNLTFVLAILRSDNNASYRDFSAVLDDYARRLAVVAAPLLNRSVEELLPSVKLAIQTIVGVFNDCALGRNFIRRPSRETLAKLFVLMVENSLQ